MTATPLDPLEIAERVTNTGLSSLREIAGRMLEDAQTHDERLQAMHAYGNSVASIIRALAQFDRPRQGGEA